VSVKHIGLVLDNLEAPAALKLVAIVLADHADSDGLCWPSYRRIAERANMSERSVRRHVHTLMQLGVITKVRSGTAGVVDGRVVRVSNAYRMHAHVLQRKLSTMGLGIAAKVGHLDVASGGQSRWPQLATKPSKNRNVNHNDCGNVDKSISATSLGDVLNDLLGHQ
jgi:DNA-binding transcriptional ArsR family regulator